MSFRAFAVAIAAAAVTGCASTSINSMRAPDAPTQAYKKLMVAFPVSDLGARAVTEGVFPSDLKKETWSQVGMNADASLFTRSTELFFPGTEYSPEETQSILEKHGIEAILVLSVHSAGTDVVGSTPTTTSVYCASGTARNCTNIAAVTTGGAPLTAEWATFRARLIDVKSGKVVWIASSNTSGTPLNSSHDLLKSMARKTLAQLEGDALVRPAFPNRTH